MRLQSPPWYTFVSTVPSTKQNPDWFLSLLCSQKCSWCRSFHRNAPNSLDMANPIPEAPPVTSATCGSQIPSVGQSSIWFPTSAISLCHPFQPDLHLVRVSSIPRHKHGCRVCVCVQSILDTALSLGLFALATRDVCLPSLCSPRVTSPRPRGRPRACAPLPAARLRETDSSSLSSSCCCCCSCCGRGSIPWIRGNRDEEGANWIAMVWKPRPTPWHRGKWTMGCHPRVVKQRMDADESASAG